MGESGTNRVWILGAGFSRSLGGPLLTDLLSQGEFLQLQARWGDLAAECAPVVKAFQWGIQGAGPGRPNLWPNAEAFLEYIGGAKPHSPAEAIIRVAAENHKIDLDE